eukprot:1944105-Alexandrium_andersonii.AAC.1
MPPPPPPPPPQAPAPAKLVPRPPQKPPPAALMRRGQAANQGPPQKAMPAKRVAKAADEKATVGGKRRITPKEAIEMAKARVAEQVAARRSKKAATLKLPNGPVKPADAAEPAEPAEDSAEEAAKLAEKLEHEKMVADLLLGYCSPDPFEHNGVWYQFEEDDTEFQKAPLDSESPMAEAAEAPTAAFAAKQEQPELCMDMLTGRLCNSCFRMTYAGKG